MSTVQQESSFVTSTSEALRVAASLKSVDIALLSDEGVAMVATVAKDLRKVVVDDFLAVENAAKRELLARMQATNARAIPSPQFEKIERKDDFSSYAFDLAKLREAALLLPPDEAAKVVKHVPEAVTVVAAHDEPGNPVSINALIKKYGETSAVGKLLVAGMKRDKIGESVDIKPLAAPKPQPTTLTVVDGGRA